MFILCISFCVCIIVYIYLYLVVFVVFFVFLQYFDTVGWVFSPVKTVSHITYTVLANLTKCRTTVHLADCSIFTRDSIYAIARIRYRPSVCLSVRPSHGCIITKAVDVRIMKFHHTVAPSL